MRALHELISNIQVLEFQGAQNATVNNLQLDSRLVSSGSLFAAIRGHAVDGHDFIDTAIEKGASAILCEEIPKASSSCSFIKVEDSAAALGEIASEFYHKPSTELKVIGITGTNGKTSVATMLYELYGSLGYKVGLISTIKYSINGEDYQSTHTTPHSIRIQELLSDMREQKCSHVFMEVSSHAIDQKRIAGLVFSGAVFTNITHDHLDYHADFKDYLYTKKKLFDQLRPEAFALFNRDDKNGQVVVQNCRATKYSFSLKSVSDFKTRIIEHDLQGMQLEIRGNEFWIRLVGEFNAYNILAVYAVAFLLDLEHSEIITALSSLQSVEGRFQHIKYKGVTAIVDYAHTPDALQNVLDTINAIRSRNENLICVLGCGGDRDKDKRPVMARIACQHSNKVVITSDNPRSEDPTAIIEDMMSGIEAMHYKKVLKITDREEAIKTAISLAERGDVILVAGKGHEKYQEINGVKHPFDDTEVLQRNLKLIQE